MRLGLWNFNLVDALLRRWVVSLYYICGFYW
jgi:hypothetical protein